MNIGIRIRLTWRFGGGEEMEKTEEEKKGEKDLLEKDKNENERGHDR